MSRFDVTLCVDITLCLMLHGYVTLRYVTWWHNVTLWLDMIFFVATWRVNQNLTNFIAKKRCNFSHEKLCYFKAIFCLFLIKTRVFSEFFSKIFKTTKQFYDWRTIHWFTVRKKTPQISFKVNWNLLAFLIASVSYNLFLIKESSWMKSQKFKRFWSSNLAV